MNTSKKIPVSLDSICNQLYWLERYIADLIVIKSYPYRDVIESSKSPHFFRMTEGLLFDSALLSIARLLDNTKKEMTIARAIDDAINDTSKRKPVDKELTEIRDKYQCIIDDRNHFIAHGKYEKIMQRMTSNEPEDTSTIADCGNAAFEIRELIEKIATISECPPPTHVVDDPSWKGAKALIESLCPYPPAFGEA